MKNFSFKKKINLESITINSIEFNIISNINCLDKFANCILLLSSNIFVLLNEKERITYLKSLKQKMAYELDEKDLYHKFGYHIKRMRKGSGSQKEARNSRKNCLY